MMYGRNTRQLGGVWGVAIVAMYLVYRIDLHIPALHDILLPLYAFIFGAALLGTWKWLRLRSPKNRRGEDRRLADRRDLKDPPPATL